MERRETSENVKEVVRGVLRAAAVMAEVAARAFVAKGTNTKETKKELIPAALEKS